VWAQGARRISRGFVCQAGELGGVGLQYKDVRAEGVGVFAVHGWMGASDVHQRIPEAAGAEEPFARCVFTAEAEGMARGGAGR
jgi:hypothetical protein